MYSSWYLCNLYLDKIGILVAHEVLLGLKKAEAGSELVLKKRKKKTKASRDGVNIKEEDYSTMH